LNQIKIEIYFNNIFFYYRVSHLDDPHVKMPSPPPSRKLFIGGAITSHKKATLQKFMFSLMPSRKFSEISYFTDSFCFLTFDNDDMCSKAFDLLSNNTLDSFKFNVERPKMYVPPAGASAGASASASANVALEAPVSALFKPSAYVNPIVEKMRRERDEKDRLRAEEEAKQAAAELAIRKAEIARLREIEVARAEQKRIADEAEEARRVIVRAEKAAKEAEKKQKKERAHAEEHAEAHAHAIASIAEEATASMTAEAEASMAKMIVLAKCYIKYSNFSEEKRKTIPATTSELWYNAYLEAIIAGHIHADV
jgi:hypothetical protein